ncbi:MAG: hypothetical protein WKF71_19310 [Pyrinomonadaceae bacterium]
MHQKSRILIFLFIGRNLIRLEIFEHYDIHLHVAARDEQAFAVARKGVVVHSLRCKIGVLFRLAARQTLLPEIACRFVVFLKYQSVARRRPTRRTIIVIERKNFKRFDCFARFKIYNAEAHEFNAVLARNNVSGCYEPADIYSEPAVFTGGVDGNVAKITWSEKRRDGSEVEEKSFLMVFPRDAKTFFTATMSISGVGDYEEIKRKSSAVGVCKNFNAERITAKDQIGWNKSRLCSRKTPIGK